jgi:hypothetical protein
VILGFLLWRRRRLLSTNQSESGTMDTRFRVSKWLRGTPSDVKAPTVTTGDEPIASGFKYDLLMPEAAGVQVHEMMGRSYSSLAGPLTNNNQILLPPPNYVARVPATQRSLKQYSARRVWFL